jgi:hypothetical protein
VAEKIGATSIGFNESHLPIGAGKLENEPRRSRAAAEVDEGRLNGWLEG